jgi:hypothetical protein
MNEVRTLYTIKFPGKCLKAFFKLKRESTVLEYTKAYETEFEIKLGSKTHIFNAKFPQFKEISCELGKFITVTIYKIPHEIDCEDLREWLSLFGEIKSNFRYNIPTLIYHNFKTSLDALFKTLLSALFKTLFSAILRHLLTHF